MQAIATLAHLTPTQLEAAERRRNFRSNIAAKAAELADRKICVSLAAIPIAAIEAPLTIEPKVKLVQPDENVIAPTPSNWFVILAADSKSRSYPSILDIQKAVARRYSIKVSDIISARRTANVVRPRQIGYYLCKELTPLSLPAIGRRFGHRDHTSILHGVKKMALLRKTDMALDAEIIDIAKELGDWHV
jgi:hypothetical protein